MSPPEGTETLTVYSDYICPFCYLGRVSLTEYQAMRDEPLRIEWHPFDLRANKRNPDGTIDHSVDDGKDDAYYEQAKQNVRRLQDQYDADMTLDLASDIDSLPAQRASFSVQRMYSYDDWLAFDTAIFDALWQDGTDISDHTELVTLADDIGIAAPDIRDALTDDDLRDELTAVFEAAHQAGVTGVPTFVYDGYAARGAVPPEQLQRLVDGT